MATNGLDWLASSEPDRGVLWRRPAPSGEPRSQNRGRNTKAACRACSCRAWRPCPRHARPGRTPRTRPGPSLPVLHAKGSLRFPPSPLKLGGPNTRHPSLEAIRLSTCGSWIRAPSPTLRFDDEGHALSHIRIDRNGRPQNPVSNLARRGWGCTTCRIDLVEPGRSLALSKPAVRSVPDSPSRPDQDRLCRSDQNLRTLRRVRGMEQKPVRRRGRSRCVGRSRALKPYGCPPQGDRIVVRGGGSLPHKGPYEVEEAPAEGVPPVRSAFKERVQPRPPWDVRPGLQPGVGLKPEGAHRPQGWSKGPRPARGLPKGVAGNSLSALRLRRQKTPERRARASPGFL